MSLVYIPSLLNHLFPVPINTESHPSYARTVVRSAEDEPFKVLYHVSKGDTLESCLNRYVGLSRGLLMWDTIHGNIVVLPKGQNKDEWLSALDTKVSLEVESASPFEAFNALEKAINSAPGSPRRLEILPFSLFNVRKPLEEFTETHTISVKLENVTAREAACAIMAASPVALSYSYMCSPVDVSPEHDEDTLWIHTYKDGKAVDGGRMTGAEALAWDQKIIEGK